MGGFLMSVQWVLIVAIFTVVAMGVAVGVYEMLSEPGGRERAFARPFGRPFGRRGMGPHLNRVESRALALEALLNTPVARFVGTRTVFRLLGARRGWRGSLHLRIHTEGVRSLTAVLYRGRDNTAFGFLVGDRGTDGMVHDLHPCAVSALLRYARPAESVPDSRATRTDTGSDAQGGGN